MTEPRKLLYWIWADMHQRCRNPNHKAYPNYGGRGITVCDEWRSSAQFLEDMGDRPEGGMLDRRDNNLGYSKANCRWATRREQNSNRRNCIFVDCDGERVVIAEFCRRKNLPYRAIMKRIRYRGWPIQIALSTPIGGRLRDATEAA